MDESGERVSSAIYDIVQTCLLRRAGWVWIGAGDGHYLSKSLSVKVVICQNYYLANRANHRPIGEHKMPRKIVNDTMPCCSVSILAFA